MTVLYGSSVADSTLTNACKMSATTGGSETSKQEGFSGSNVYGEMFSQGGTAASVSALPTPTGHGWVYPTGAGTFATGNWSAAIGVSDVGGPYSNTSLTIRFYRYSGGSYTSIGSIVLSSPTIPATRGTLSFTATSMSTITFAASDLLYVDLWWKDSGISADVPKIYESSSSTAGVASDMQVTTSTFTASVGNSIIGDGYGGTFS